MPTEIISCKILNAKSARRVPMMYKINPVKNAQRLLPIMPKPTAKLRTH